MLPLNVQTWLREQNFDFAKLEAQLGIKATFHPADNRAILNYSQINSPKSNPIVRECRGLVLDKTNADIVARAFPRFYNWGELEHEEKWFVWENCFVNHKEDGSLILLYYHNDSWHMNTRGSFGTGEVIQGVMTWQDLFKLAMPNLEDFVKKEENRSFTWVFELCSQYNKVVRHYDKPQVFLLSAYQGVHELLPNVVDALASDNNLQRPLIVQCRDIFDVTAYICKLERDDKTFEGVVIRDINNQRWKIKNPSYISLHKCINNHTLTKERMIDIIYTVGTGEFLTYFSEFKDTIALYETKIDILKNEIKNSWIKHKDIRSQKEFALAVKDLSYKALLFEARKREKEPLELLTADYLSKLV